MGTNTLIPLKYTAYVSSYICVMAIAAEMIRIVEEGQRLIARLEAGQRHQQVEYDFEYLSCLLYFVPGTDLPSHPGGVAFKPLLHAINIILLGLVILEEYPRQAVTEKLQIWCLPFSIQCSCWYAGAVQLIIGLGQIGQPTGVVGNARLAEFRLISGFILTAIGAINVVIGAACSYDIRWFRDQYDRPEEEDWDRKQRCRDKWLLWRAIIGNIYAEHLAVGELRDAIGQVDDLVQQMMLE